MWRTNLSPSFDSVLINSTPSHNLRDLSIKGSESANTVHIFMVIIRLVEFNTDILLTMNVPVAFGVSSSSLKNCYLPDTVSDQAGMEVFGPFLESFAIHEYEGLFNV